MLVQGRLRARRCGHRAAPVPVLCQAAQQPSSSGSEGPSSSKVELPTKGLFAIADTKAEVYSKAGEKFDPAKKGGRYKPEFIWNTNWQEALAREESLERKVKEAKERRANAAPDSGMLSLSRLSELDNMDADFTEILLKKGDIEQQAKQAAAAAAAASTTIKKKRAAPVAGPSFSRSEVSRLVRATRASTRAANVVAASLVVLDEEQKQKAEVEKQKYEQLKVESQLLCVTFSVAGFAVTYISYSQDIAVSYAVGALAGFLYLRLLGRSVDSVGLSAAIGQPRLLIPVVMALAYNRWNELYAVSTGVQLSLLPMLVGFFTYKLALVTRQYKEVMDDMLPKAKSQDA